MFLEIRGDVAPEVSEDDPNYDGADFLDNMETTRSSRDNVPGEKIVYLWAKSLLFYTS